ncbi:MAG: hypothetical protein QME51_08050 [Planctomycetota bacterium]|nr:hypothetical protein [Planctomycetota bacterium]MDI6788309.1 hypothetical protein [Planctomycetota bacterium]
MIELFLFLSPAAYGEPRPAGAGREATLPDGHRGRPASGWR